MTVLCLGQARSISETAQAWPPSATDSNGTLVRVCEMLRNNAVSMVDLAASIMDEAWIALFAGQIVDPQVHGEKLDWLLRTAGDSITSLEALMKGRRDAGLAVPDLAPLVRSHEILDGLVQRFRAGWPYLPPAELAEVEQARQRSRSEYLTLEEFARGLASSAQP
jgi:hypothetical protein